MNNKGVCYLILCHDNLPQILRMIDFLSSDDAYFVVHVDRKSKEDYHSLSNKNHVIVVPNPVNVSWGDMSVIDAVLKMSKLALGVATNVSHYILLSGTDFPVKSHQCICNYLYDHCDTDFIEGINIPSDDICWLEGGRRRLEAYVVPFASHNSATIEPRKFSRQNFRQFVKIAKYNMRWLGYALKIFLFYQRRDNPFNMKFYAGEMWWILSRSTLQNVIIWNDQHPNYYIFHESTQIPDEIYINSIVYMLSNHIDNDIKRYIAWDNKTDKSPKWLKLSKDKCQIEGCIKDPDVFFVRKVKDPDIVVFIQTNINKS